LISRDRVQQLVTDYGAGLSVATLGSHSALDIFDGAKDEGFRTLAVCQEGREKTYQRFRRIIDEVLLVPRFVEVTTPAIQEQLRRKCAIFIPHRAFTAYVGYDAIENEFLVPLFGSRALLRAEERTASPNQYDLLAQATIAHPRRFATPDAIKGPVVVKVQEARRPLERAFFVAASRQDFQEKAAARLRAGTISSEGLQQATIEELVLGTYFNFNYFYSPLSGELEFLGIDRRLQTNIQDATALPAGDQLSLVLQLQNIEVGHMPATIRESLLERVFDIGERFVAATQQAYPPGIIGPFALQSVVTVDLDIVVYDVSPRVPGSPILTTTSPYTKYAHGSSIGTGRRIAIELKRAQAAGRLSDVVT
jgi:5-formaminoimidazole-4-carboxamide-1-(beta)-D-ribofuranosyl 5'-monophosphate synthetase